MQYGGMVRIGGGEGEIIRESDLETLRRGASLVTAGTEKERQRLVDQRQKEMLGTPERIAQGKQFDVSTFEPGTMQERKMNVIPVGAGTEAPSPYPAGVQQVMAGRPIEQPRSLFRPAGLRVPSAQAMRNLVPEEMEAYRELGTLAGIPKGAYEREFKQAMPGGQARVRRPRFQARRQRRL